MLNKEAVLDAAIRLIERDGVDGLTMRALGAELGVEAMALYYYFRKKDELYDAIVDRLALEVEVPEAGSTAWPEAATRLVRSFRELGRRYPHSTDLLLRRSYARGEAARKSEAAVAHTIAAGVDHSTALLIYRALSAYAWGTLLEDRRAQSPLSTGNRDQEFEFGLDALIQGLKQVVHAPAPKAGERPRRGARSPAKSDLS